MEIVSGSWYSRSSSSSSSKQSIISLLLFSDSDAVHLPPPCSPPSPPTNRKPTVWFPVLSFSILSNYLLRFAASQSAPVRRSTGDRIIWYFLPSFSYVTMLFCTWSACLGIHFTSHRKIHARIFVFLCNVISNSDVFVQTFQN